MSYLNHDYTRLLFIPDPLEQFDVIQLFPSIHYALTNLTFILFLNLLLFGFLIYATIYPQTKLIALSFRSRRLGPQIYEMVANLADSNIRLKLNKFTFQSCSTFLC